MAPKAPIIVAAADPDWARQFRELGATLRSALGPAANRIDHVGSTAVPELDAKPVLDVQVSVPRLEPDLTYRIPLESLGFVLERENPDRTKRFFHRGPAARAVHLHVRVAGCFDEQLNLLFRDYLRSDEAARREYAAIKRELALRFRDDREGYVRAKEPTVWALLVRAHSWLQETGWSPGPADA
jgi:GrpB-like predicted nucleotidyltransferase (UPF0157 family)